MVRVGQAPAVGASISAAWRVAFMVSVALGVAELSSVPQAASVDAAQADTWASGAARELTPPPQIGVSLRALQPLIDRVPGSTPGLRSAKQRAMTALHTLISLSATWPAQSPVAYRLDLAEAVTVLEGAVASSESSQLERAIQVVADDLEIKREHSRMSGGRLGALVDVRVRALRGADEVLGLGLFCVSAITQLLESGSRERPPQSTAERQALLAPGRYVIWLKDATEHVVVEPTLIKVGEGRKQLQLDVLARIAPAR